MAPLPVAPVNETDMILLPQSLKALKQVAKQVGVDLSGAYLNLDGGFDSNTTTRVYSRWVTNAIRRLRCERYAAWFRCW